MDAEDIVRAAHEDVAAHRSLTLDEAKAKIQEILDADIRAGRSLRRAMRAEDIVRALAAQDEPMSRGVDERELDYCSLCGEGGLTTHDPDCPWRLAREAVAEWDKTPPSPECAPYEADIR